MVVLVSCENTGCLDLVTKCVLHRAVRLMSTVSMCCRSYSLVGQRAVIRIRILYQREGMQRRERSSFRWWMGEVSAKVVDPPTMSSQAAAPAPAAPPAAAAPKSKDELALLVKDLTSPSQCEATQYGAVQAMV